MFFILLKYIYVRYIFSQHDMQKIQELIQEQEVMLEEFQMRNKKSGEKSTSLEASFENLCGMMNFTCWVVQFFHDSYIYWCFPVVI